MRILIFVLAIALTLPALAAGGWETYANKRYGATASVPPGFEPMGPEAANSDGMIFRSRAGNALITIYGDEVPGGDFDAYIAKRIAFEESYSGWAIMDKTVTPGWAEYTGHIGSRQLRVRTLRSCGGRQVVSVKLEYNGNMSSVVSRVQGSLKVGPAASCQVFRPRESAARK